MAPEDDDYSSMLRRQMESPVATPPPTSGGAARKLIIVAAALGAFGIGFAFFGVFALMGRSDAAKLAIATAESSPALASRLGKPLKAGLLVSGNIAINNGSGHAELSIPIGGPKGSGTLFVEETRRAGTWEIKSLEFRAQDGRGGVNLLPADSNPLQAFPSQ